MKKPQPMTVSNEAYTKIQIFRIGRFVAVALKYMLRQIRAATSLIWAFDLNPK